MPLADVLKFLGEAIVTDVGPGELQTLARTWPGLSEAEREDLLKIPHHRLYPYQSDFYTFERGMVEWGFEHTWLALRAANFGRDAAEDVDDAARAFMVDFKNRYPSRTHSVREMAGHFIAFLREAGGALKEKLPWLGDLAEMERLEIEVLYALDNPHGAPLHGAALEAFFARDLGEVLDARVVRAEWVSVLQSEYDLPAIKAAFRAGEAVGAEAFRLESPRHWIVARDPEDLAPVWYVASDLEAAMLPRVSEEQPLSIESLAETYLSKCGVAAGEEEEALLGECLLMVHAWFARRYLLAAK